MRLTRPMHAMHMFDDVLDLAVVEASRRQIETHFEAHVRAGHDHLLWYPTRRLDISDHEVVGMLQRYLARRIRPCLVCDHAELQTWPTGVESFPERPEGARGTADYTSCLYLNDDFEGGELYAEPGVRIKPFKNRLVLFEGRTSHQGVTKVEGRHRYALMIWWRAPQP